MGRYIFRLLRHVLVLAGALMTWKAAACGISWKLPQNHFDGVNEQGYLSYWQKIGEINLGDDLKIPLNINFCSGRQATSSELGRGWLFALLDSNIVQYDDNNFILYQPDGQIRRFRREESDPNLLRGGGWTAQIGGNQITVWSDCGWKLQFNQGKLVTITTPKSRRINIIYADGKAIEVRDEGTPVLTVDRDPQTQYATAISIGGKKIVIEQAQRPIVQNIGGSNIIGATSLCLHKLIGAEGNISTYDFGVDKNLAPTLLVGAGSQRSFTWDPVRNLLRKDGNWTYLISPSDDPFSNAEISRTNNLNQHELWFFDRYKNLEITQGIDGVQKTITRFSSGKLQGLVRKVEETKDGKTTIIESDSYDEKGRLIRVVDAAGSKSFIYDDDCHAVDVFKGGKWLWTVNSDDSNRVVAISTASGTKQAFEYLISGQTKETFTLPSGKSIVRLTGDN